MVAFNGWCVLLLRLLLFPPLQGPNTRMVLERCLLHVGISLMAGRLDATDCTIKGSGDSLLAEPGTTLVLRRCQFVDVADPLVIESSTAVVEGCKCWAYDRGPVVVTCGHNAEEAFDGHLNDEINSKILFLEVRVACCGGLGFDAGWAAGLGWLACVRGVRDAGQMRSTGVRIAAKQMLQHSPAADWRPPLPFSSPLQPHRTRCPTCLYGSPCTPASRPRARVPARRSGQQCCGES